MPFTFLSKMFYVQKQSAKLVLHCVMSRQVFQLLRLMNLFIRGKIDNYAVYFLI